MELKPCPFCGGNAEPFAYEIKKRKAPGNIVYAAIRCFRCNVHMCKELHDLSMEDAEAIMKCVWNRRTDLRA